MTVMKPEAFIIWVDSSYYPFRPQDRFRELWIYKRPMARKGSVWAFTPTESKFHILWITEKDFSEVLSQAKAKGTLVWVGKRKQITESLLKKLYLKKIL